MKSKLQQIGEQLLPAIAYGDAAGLPVETRTADDIEAEYGYINSLLGTVDNPYFSGEFKPGVWSDDTQLSLAVAKALLIEFGFDIDRIAEQHIRAFNDTPDVVRGGQLRKRGWGRSTEDSVARLKAGRRPHMSGNPGGTGNGVLMKLAPLVYWQYVKMVGQKESYRQYDMLTTLTHDTDTARVCTRVHGDVLSELIRGPAGVNIAGVAIRSAAYHEAAFGNRTREVSKALQYLTAWRPSTETVLDETDGNGLYAPQTLAMAYGNMIVNSGDFSDVVYGAVNMGGDTDTIASMCAAMEVFIDGEVAMPEDAHLLQDLENIQTIGTKLGRLAVFGS